MPAFAPAGIALALGYDALLTALAHVRVSVVSPLNATGSLWAVLLAAIVFGHNELIGPRTVLAALLVVAGGSTCSRSLLEKRTTRIWYPFCTHLT